MSCPHCRRVLRKGNHGYGVCVEALDDGMRRCTKCREVKLANLENFSRDYSTDKWRAWCRTCAAAQSSARGEARSTDPLKRLACLFGSAKKGSPLEAERRRELLQAVQEELACAAPPSSASTRTASQEAKVDSQGGA